MKVRLILFFVGLMCAAPAPCVLAQGAPRSIVGVLQAVTPGITSISIPSYGTVGAFSLTTLGTLPVLSSIPLPLIGSFGGVPVIGDVTPQEGLTIIESITPLKIPLTGLGGLGAALP